MQKIGPLAIAVMGLLEERPRHPYDIAFTMQTRRMDEHIKLSLGALYHVVDRLQRLGWVEPTRTGREGRRPERTIYAVTAEGRARFHERLRELVSEPVREYSGFEAGLTFVHQLPPEEAAALLRRRADRLREQMALWDHSRQRLQEKGLTRLALLEAEMVQDWRCFQAHWCLRIAAEIESGRVTWSLGPTEGPTPPAGAAERPAPAEEETL